jgi:acyl-CoA synthetase (AMP-forming)/AMP-acid ligase II
MMNFYDDIEVFGDSTAIITDSLEQVSYSQLIQQTDKFKKYFDDKCIVFNLSSNCLESVVGYIGFLRAKVVPLLISNNIHSDLFDNLIKSYQPAFVWLPTSKIFNLSDYHEVYSYRNYALYKSNSAPIQKINTDLALLLSTSGSTGSPKLVRQSYKNINSNAASIAQYLNISSNDRPITTLPMSYTFGLSIINSHFLCGSTIILTDKTLVDKAFWTNLKVNKASTFSGVPFTFGILKKLRFNRMNLSSIKYLTQAGGKLNENLVKEFGIECEKKGIEFIVMYGQCEATARMSYLPSKYTISKPGSIGFAIPGGTFLIESEFGEEVLEEETVGELVYKGDNVTMGYANSYNDLSKADENQGILKTGDMAKRDCDGFYYIVGRKKRFLKIFGNRINLDEVEQLLADKGLNAVCAGTDESLKIFITDKEKVMEAQVIVSNYTALHISGFEVKFIDAIPRNEYGRVTYSLLN